MTACPRCGEQDDLRGRRTDDGIDVACGACRLEWVRSLDPVCARCGASDLFEAVAAIVEKGRGTQLSVVGSKVVHLCEACDAKTIRTYLDSRPNPLMPDQLPNTDGDMLS